LKEIEWRVISDFPKYSISEFGEIRSSYKTCKILKPKYDKDGYAGVALSKDGRVCHLRVHRLVAMAFLANPDNLPVVNHKDLNVINNHYSNLEWCTAYDNTLHYYANGLGRRTLASLTKEEMLSLVDDYNSGKSQKDLKDKYNLECRADAISEIVTGRRFSSITGITKSDDFKQRTTAKLSDDEVYEILKKYWINNTSQTDLCAHYEMSVAQMSRIVNGHRRVEVYSKFMKENHGKQET
jgi:hypothetical protein